MLRKVAPSAKEFDIVGLIDIVFLLIVFGIAMATFIGESKQNRPPDTIEECLLTFVVQPMVTQDPSLPQRSYLSIEEAPFDTHERVSFEPDDEIVQLSMDDFASTEACQVISYVLERYSIAVASDSITYPRAVRLKVHRNTKMRIISFVSEACALYPEELHNLDIMVLQ